MSAAWLQQHRHDPDDVVIAAAMADEYAAHIPVAGGAVHSLTAAHPRTARPRGGTADSGTSVEITLTISF